MPNRKEGSTNLWGPLKSQIASIRLELLLVTAFISLVIGSAIAIHTVKDVPYGDLTRDLIAIYRGRFYMGFMSQIGINLWSASAAVFFLTALVLRGRGEDQELIEFALFSGLISLVLGFDDTFMVHEKLSDKLEIPQAAIFSLYGVIVLGYLARHNSRILETKFILLIVAFVFFAISVGSDLFYPKPNQPLLQEDGSKLAGIVSWLAYSFSACLDMLRAKVSRRRTAD